jgi:XTP/dITP diphosphohydrolase
MQLEGKVVFFATRNINKFNEARKVFAEYKIALGMIKIKKLEIQSESLEDIARTSVIEAYRKCNLPMIVEDAGLFVNSLNGFPGPYSSYVYTKIGNEGLLRLVENNTDRKAKFVSIVAYYAEDIKRPILFPGEVNGEITRKIRKKDGTSGFGFDPIFCPKNSNKVFAEMTIAEKNRYSHRAQALHKFGKWYMRL